MGGTGETSVARSTTTFNERLGNRLGEKRRILSPRTTVAVARPAPHSITVTWADGQTSRFSTRWLRFNCFCVACGTSDDGIRSIDIMSVPDGISPARVDLTSANTVDIDWTDGHVSTFGGEWLRAYCNAPEERSRRRAWTPELWKSDLIERLPRATYSEVAINDEARLAMFEHVRDLGFVMIDGVGPDPELTEPVAAMFGPIHSTSNYGYISDVQSKPVAKLGGETAIHQHPHSDDTFQYSPPGIVIFHCIQNNDDIGGVSSYVDGFAVAADLRSSEPEAFDLLSSVPVQFVRRRPGHFDIRAEGRVIRLDDHGRIAGIRYFDRAAAPLDVEEGLVDAMLSAQSKFLERVVSPEFKMDMKLSAGTVIVVDNHRVMHGRSAFDQQSERRLRTCTTDRDEFHGYWRDLANRLGRDDYDLVMTSGAI